MSRILVLSFSDLTRDPRVDRQINILREEHDVIAAGLGPPVDADVPFIDLRLAEPHAPVAERVRQVRSLARMIGCRHDTVYWSHPLNRAAFERLSGHGADLVIANDLSALPLASRAADGAAVVFDAHELSIAEDADHLWWRVIVAPYVDSLLRTYLPQTTGMMTVASGIAERYRRDYGVNPVVVTNAPPMAPLEPSPVGEPIRLIHHGSADPQRRLELMIEAVDRLDDRFELNLMLVPKGERYFERIAEMASDRERVQLIEPVPQREIVRALNRFDVGVYLLPPLNDNLLHALPNKLFEFIQARLAVAIGPSVEMAAIVRESACGVIASDFTADTFAAALRDLNRERIAEYKVRAGAAAQRHNAERNRETLLSLVDVALAR
jgi:hypothetical protein